MIERLSPKAELTYGIAGLVMDAGLAVQNVALAINNNLPLPIRLIPPLVAFTFLGLALHGGIRTFKESRAQKRA